MNRATIGTPTTSTMAPSTRHARRQPTDSINASAAGGSTIAPIAPPDITTASAVPRRRSNQLETAREYAICAVPLPTIAQHEERGVEVPEARRQQRQRRERAAEDDQAGNDDPRRLHSIEEVSERRGARGHGHRGDAEGRRHRFARPGELLGERLQEHAEGVDQQRGEADEDADAGRTGDTPAFIAKGGLAPGILARSDDCSEGLRPSIP